MALSSLNGWFSSTLGKSDLQSDLAIWAGNEVIVAVKLFHEAGRAHVLTDVDPRYDKLCHDTTHAVSWPLLSSIGLSLLSSCNDHALPTSRLQCMNSTRVIAAGSASRAAPCALSTWQWPSVCPAGYRAQLCQSATTQRHPGSIPMSDQKGPQQAND